MTIKPKTGQHTLQETNFTLVSPEQDAEKRDLDTQAKDLRGEIRDGDDVTVDKQAIMDEDENIQVENIYIDKDGIVYLQETNAIYGYLSTLTGTIVRVNECDSNDGNTKGHSTQPNAKKVGVAKDAGITNKAKDIFKKELLTDNKVNEDDGQSKFSNQKQDETEITVWGREVWENLLPRRAPKGLTPDYRVYLERYLARGHRPTAADFIKRLKLVIDDGRRDPSKRLGYYSYRYIQTIKNLDKNVLLKKSGTLTDESFEALQKWKFTIEAIDNITTQSSNSLISWNNVLPTDNESLTNLITNISQKYRHQLTDRGNTKLRREGRQSGASEAGNVDRSFSLWEKHANQQIQKGIDQLLKNGGKENEVLTHNILSNLFVKRKKDVYGIDLIKRKYAERKKYMMDKMQLSSDNHEEIAKIAQELKKLVQREKEELAPKGEAYDYVDPDLLLVYGALANNKGVVTTAFNLVKKYPKKIAQLQDAAGNYYYKFNSQRRALLSSNKVSDDMKNFLDQKGIVESTEPKKRTFYITERQADFLEGYFAGLRETRAADVTKEMGYTEPELPKKGENLTHIDPTGMIGEGNAATSTTANKSSFNYKSPRNNPMTKNINKTDYEKQLKNKRAENPNAASDVTEDPKQFNYKEPPVNKTGSLIYSKDTIEPNEGQKDYYTKESRWPDGKVYSKKELLSIFESMK
jgi:hypothetical protein